MSSEILNDRSMDLDADYYVKHSSLQNNLAQEILINFQINSGANILDVGCGDGRITVELANKVRQGKVLGIDASPRMIEFAVKNFPQERFPNLRFLQMKAEYVELPQQYDLIASFSCFHWIKDPKLAIRRLVSCLKTGGEFLILTYPKESPYYQYLEIALKKYPEYSSLSANLNMLSANEYKNLFITNGLNILEFQQRHLMASYSSSKEIQEYIRGWLNSFVSLPETLHDSFLQDVSQVILRDPTTTKNGKIIVPYTALVIKAQKE